VGGCLLAAPLGCASGRWTYGVNTSSMTAESFICFKYFHMW